VFARIAVLLLLLLLLVAGCQPQGRSVRAWIESRDPDGRIVAGASVHVDGQPAGMTDQRGLFRLKIRRRVGSSVNLVVQNPTGMWVGTFTVGTNGEPVEHDGGRITAVLPGGER